MTLLNLTLEKLKPTNETFKKVRVIVKSWWIIISSILFAALFAKNGFLLLFSFLSYAVIREYFKNSQVQYYRTQMKFFIYCSVTIQIVLIVMGEFLSFAIFPCIFALATVPLLLFRQHTMEDLTRYLAAYLGVLLFSNYILYSLALVYSGPEWLGGFDQTLLLFCLILGLTQLNDVFQFVFGKSFGKRKVVPHLSPNKTEAGFIGGIIFTTILGTFLFHHLISTDWYLSAGLSFTISIFGIFGDLTFSTVKRFLKIKDFSDTIPGHGGFLDRMDSLIFTAPIIFHILNIYYR